MTDEETKELFSVDPEPTVPRPSPADEATAAGNNPPEKEPLNPYKYQRITMPPGLRAELIALARDQKPQRFLEDTVPPNAGGAETEAERTPAADAVAERAEVPEPAAGNGESAGDPGASWRRRAGWMIAAGLCVAAGVSAAVAVSRKAAEPPSIAPGSPNEGDVARVISNPENTAPRPNTEPPSRGVAAVTQLTRTATTPSARPLRPAASAAKSPTVGPSSSGALPAKKRTTPAALDTKSPIFSE